MNPGPRVQSHQDSPSAWFERDTRVPADAHPEPRVVFAELLRNRHAVTPGSGTPEESGTFASIKDRNSKLAVPATRKKAEARGKPGGESIRPYGEAKHGGAPRSSKSLESLAVENESTDHCSWKSASSSASARRATHPEDSTPACALLGMADPNREPPPARAFSGASDPESNGADPDNTPDGEAGAPPAADSRLLGGNSAGHPARNPSSPARLVPGRATDTGESPLSSPADAELLAEARAAKTETQAPAPAREHQAPAAASGLTTLAVASANSLERGSSPPDSMEPVKESATLSSTASPEATDLPSTPNDPDRKDHSRGGTPDPRRGGMPDAPSDMPMKMASRMNQFALLNEQYLPPQPGGQTATPASAMSSGERRTDHASADPLATGTLINGFLATPALQNPAASAISAAPMADRTSQVEKLAGLFTGKTVELKQAGAVQMTAVLRPDAQTELHVHLRLESTGIEIHARCEQGDSRALGAQWHQIQQALAPQGIRLANLNEPPPGSAKADAFSGPSGQPSQQPSDRQEARRHQTPGRFGEELATPATAPATSARRHSRSTPLAGRRWETWA